MPARSRRHGSILHHVLQGWFGTFMVGAVAGLAFWPHVEALAG